MPVARLYDVSGLDASAVNVFYRVIRSARSLETKIVLSALPEQFESTLQRSLPEGEWESLLFEDDLDRGLERCEHIVIAEWFRLHVGSEDARTRLFDLSIDDAVHQLDRQARFEDIVARLRPWLKSCSYATDESIVVRGEQQGGMQLLVRGRATMRGEEAGRRIDEFGPGSVLAPQAAFGHYVAVVEVTAEEPCETVLVTPSEHQSLEREDPDLTRELVQYLMAVILDYQTRLTIAVAGRETPQT